jgi:hypothetical protein
MTEASKISNLNRMVLKTSVLLINFVSELRSTLRQLKKNFQSGSWLVEGFQLYYGTIANTDD